MKATTPLSTRWERRLINQPAVVAPVTAMPADPALETPTRGTRSAEYRAWRRGRGGAYFALKRALDIGVALLALIFSAPLLALIAALIWLEDGGSVIYTRQVIGERGRLFTMYKFRTMCEQAEELLQQDAALMAEYQRQHFKLRRDPRVTRLGQTLRKYSLDELPQFFNILVGQMSLVGPRAVPLTEIEQFGEMAALRAWVRPGLSGLWQVSGRSDTTYAARIRLDGEYVERCSLGLDLRILLRTLPAVARGVGAY
jgi:exopolysaccharide production protein ExoY